MIFLLLSKSPRHVYSVEPEFLTLFLHVTLIKLDSNKNANLYLDFFRFLKTHSEGKYFVYLLTYSNFFGDIMTYQRKCSINSVQTFGKVSKVSRIPSIF